MTATGSESSAPPKLMAKPPKGTSRLPIGQLGLGTGGRGQGWVNRYVTPFMHIGDYSYRWQPAHEIRQTIAFEAAKPTDRSRRPRSPFASRWRGSIREKVAGEIGLHLFATSCPASHDRHGTEHRHPNIRSASRLRYGGGTSSTANKILRHATQTPASRVRVQPPVCRAVMTH
jgi:hypothetical protein